MVSLYFLEKGSICGSSSVVWCVYCDSLSFSWSQYVDEKHFPVRTPICVIDMHDYVLRVNGRGVYTNKR